MTRQHMFATVIGPLVVLMLGTGLLVWPNYRSAHAAAEEIDRLQGMIGSMSQLTSELEQMGDDHAALQQQMTARMKDIPGGKDVASLMRRLSFPVDRVTVMSHTVTVGNAGDAITGVPTSEKSLPLTVEMNADFDSIFALIRIAESMDRLVRVASVHVNAEDEQSETGERGLLKSTIVLEAIYDSGEMPGDES